MSPGCLGGWILVVAELDVDVKLVGVAAVQATHRWGSVTRSSSRLLAGASMVKARRLGGTCVELDGAQWLVACAKLVGTAAATSAPLFRIEVINDGT
jgi:hypothetical protein